MEVSSAESNNFRRRKNTKSTLRILTPFLSFFFFPALPLPQHLSILGNPESHTPTGSFPSQMFNVHGSLLTHLPQQRFPARKIYPNLVKLPPLKPFTDGVERVIISDWHTDPSKKNLGSVLERRARSFRQIPFVMDKTTKWMTFKHPRIYGATIDQFVDTLMYEMLKWEFSHFKANRAARFVPPTWLSHSTSTNVGVKPNKICPRLSMIDLNKDKEKKHPRHKRKMPVVEDIMLDLNSDPFDHSQMDYIQSLPIEMVIEANYVGAFWQSHLIHCTREASTSGLSAKEKKNSPKFIGRCGLSSVRYLIFKDLWGLPITSRDVEIPNPIHWAKDIPEPIIQYAFATTSTSSSEHTTEELVVECPELNVEIFSKPASEPSTPLADVVVVVAVDLTLTEQSDEICASKQGAESAETSSQPLALAMVHHPAQAQDTVSDSAERSRQLSLPPNLEDIIGRKVDDKVGKIVEEKTEEMAQQIEERVQKQVQDTLAPTNAMVTQMLALLMEFQKNQNPNQPPPPPPSS